MDLNALIRTVQRNCDISDARHVGGLSLCSFLLLLRNFYKWEEGSPPWKEGDPSSVMEWIEARESLWERIGEMPFQSLPVDGEKDPFSVDAVNRAVEDRGMVYGAGYAGGLKPTFFLAHLEKKKEIQDLTVYFLGRESARDMMGVPAMRTGSCLYIRKECARFFWWDRLFEKLSVKKTAAMFALQEYGVRDLPGLKRMLDAIVEAQVEVMVRHEVGEARIGFDTPLKKLISAFPATPVERFVRALRDVMADTHPEGTLSFIIRHRRKASLGFYVSLLDGFPRYLFPEIQEAFRRFTRDFDWEPLEAVREGAYARLSAKAGELAALSEEMGSRGPDFVCTAIRERMVDPILGPRKAIGP